MILRTVTFNFLHGGSAKRNGHWSRIVNELQPDVVLCQEARPPEAGLLTPETQLYWNAAPEMRWGTGVLLRSCRGRHVSLPGYEGWVEGVELEIGHDLVMLSVHSPPGVRGYVDSVNRILDAIDVHFHGRTLVIGGDFNIAVGYRESNDPVKVSATERAVLDRLGDEFGLIACWQAVHPDEPLAQTLRWMRNPTTPYHCDGFFIPRSWAPAIRRCEVIADADWHSLSDHSPVLLDLDLSVAPTSGDRVPTGGGNGV